MAGFFRHLAQFDQSVIRRVFLARLAIDRDRAALLFAGHSMLHRQLAHLARLGRIDRRCDIGEGALQIPEGVGADTRDLGLALDDPGEQIAERP